MENRPFGTNRKLNRKSSITLDKVLAPERVLILTCSTKTEVLNALIECLAQTPQVKDPQALAEGVFKREALMSTGIGLGIGIPHVRLNTVEDVVAAAALCREPIIDYESLDGQPIRLVFMIAACEGQHEQYIRLLASLSSRLKDETLRNALIAAPDPETFHRILIQRSQ